MNTKNITLFLGVVGIIIFIIIIFSTSGDGPVTNVNQSANNVSVVDGKQIIAIGVRGGYSPRVTNAKAGEATIIQFNTQNAFDCSSALVIQSLGYKKNLPPSGQTLLEIPAQEAGSSLRGTCSMGMYDFIINFN